MAWFDTSIPLPYEIQLESNDLTLAPGGSQHFNFIVSSKIQQESLGASLILSSANDSLMVTLEHDTRSNFQLEPGSSYPVHTAISVSEDALPGTYKILLGAQSSDVAISKFVTVTVE